MIIGEKVFGEYRGVRQGIEENETTFLLYRNTIKRRACYEGSTKEEHEIRARSAGLLKKLASVDFAL